MPPVGFEPKIPASAQPQTFALERAATAIGCIYRTKLKTEDTGVSSNDKILKSRFGRFFEKLDARTHAHTQA
jgi:hypothetical protein